MGLMAAELIRLRRRDWEDHAREILDSVCLPWVGCDAEFESDKDAPSMADRDDIAGLKWPAAPWGAPYVFYHDPNGPLGLLIRRVFGDVLRRRQPRWNRLCGIEDRDCVQWRRWERLLDKFCEHYDFH